MQSTEAVQRSKLERLVLRIKTMRTIHDYEQSMAHLQAILNDIDEIDKTDKYAGDDGTGITVPDLGRARACVKDTMHIMRTMHEVVGPIDIRDMSARCAALTTALAGYPVYKVQEAIALVAADFNNFHSCNVYGREFKSKLMCLGRYHHFLYDLTSLVNFLGSWAVTLGGYLMHGSTL
jgi:hypothetical protein